MIAPSTSMLRQQYEGTISNNFVERRISTTMILFARQPSDCTVRRQHDVSVTIRYSIHRVPFRGDNAERNSSISRGTLDSQTGSSTNLPALRSDGRFSTLSKTVRNAINSENNRISWTNAIRLRAWMTQINRERRRSRAPVGNYLGNWFHIERIEELIHSSRIK